MGYKWTDISNGEVASSVRSKINGLGQYADNMLVVKSDVSVPTSLWVSDTTYSPLAYKATITLSDVEATDIVNVSFSQTDQATCNYIGGEANDGSISIYAITKPTADLTIPQILIFKGVV